MRWSEKVSPEKKKDTYSSPMPLSLNSQQEFEQEEIELVYVLARRY